MVRKTIAQLMKISQIVKREGSEHSDDCGEAAGRVK